MKQRMIRMLKGAKAAVIAGDAHEAIRIIEGFSQLAERIGVPEEDREYLEWQLGELRNLAEASVSGAKRAIEQVAAIMQAARSLQTYDETGRKQSTTTAAPSAQRF